MVWEAVEASFDAEKVRTAAPPITAEALQLIFFEDQPKQKVAAQLGLDCFELYRQMKAFAAAWQIAA